MPSIQAEQELLREKDEARAEHLFLVCGADDGHEWLDGLPAAAGEREAVPQPLPMTEGQTVEHPGHDPCCSRDQCPSSHRGGSIEDALPTHGEGAMALGWR